MGNQSRYIVGCDLNDMVTQLSYFELNKDEPETLISDGENERLGIPTVLCKRRKVNQWSIGTEAIRLIEKDGEAEVNKLVSLALSDSKISIDEEEFTGIDLLILFLRKSLNLLSVYVSMDQIDSFIFTVPKLDSSMLSVLERVSVALPVGRDKIAFQSYSESVFYYMLHQEEELFKNEVVVLDHDGADINCYYMHLNHRTKPIVGMVDEYFFDDFESPDSENATEEEKHLADEKLLSMLHDFLMAKTVRAVYLLGDGFDGEWCKKTVSFLCMGRRVFQGKNMYSKGACYYGKDRIEPTGLNETYVFLGRDKLQFNLGMYVEHNGEEEYIALADGGENWFESESKLQLLLADGNKIKLIVTPLDGKEIRDITINLDGLKQRPLKTTRLELNVSFKSGTKVYACVKDLGFGEIFPSTGQYWEKEVEIF